MWRWLLVAAALLQQATPLSVSEINVPKFCAECGGRTMAARTPPGDERPRAVCGACGYVAYENPKVVVAVVESLHQAPTAVRSSVVPDMA